LKDILYYPEQVQDKKNHAILANEHGRQGLSDITDTTAHTKHPLNLANPYYLCSCIFIFK
jgi:hypothetical protein